MAFVLQGPLFGKAVVPQKAVVRKSPFYGTPKSIMKIIYGTNCFYLLLVILTEKPIVRKLIFFKVFRTFILSINFHFQDIQLHCWSISCSQKVSIFQKKMLENLCFFFEIMMQKNQTNSWYPETNVLLRWVLSKLINMTRPTHSH